MSKKELLFSYRGRISIRQFWLGKGLVYAFTLAGFIIWGVFSPVAYSWELGLPPSEHWATDTLMTVMWGWLILVFIAKNVMNFAVLVKRCHDRGRSGWFSLLAVIPFLGVIWQVIDLGILKGHDGPSRYGPCPPDRTQAAQAGR